MEGAYEYFYPRQEELITRGLNRGRGLNRELQYMGAKMAFHSVTAFIYSINNLRIRLQARSFYRLLVKIYWYTNANETI